MFIRKLPTSSTKWRLTSYNCHFWFCDMEYRPYCSSEPIVYKSGVVKFKWKIVHSLLSPIDEDDVDGDAALSTTWNLLNLTVKLVNI